MDTDDFLHAQAVATEKFRLIITSALAEIRKLAFPLGGPTPGYDMLDITATLREWLVPRSTAALQRAAEDAAREAENEAESDFADWQYHNRREMEDAP